MSKKSNDSHVGSTAFTLAKNTGYNLFTQGVLTLLAIWAIPHLIHSLGNERFGILTLLWALVGYFSLLDLGISRANTKYLSGAIALGNSDFSKKIIWSSLSLSAGIGLVSMVVILGTTPYVLTNIFKVTPSLYRETSQAFLFAALSLPFMVIYGTIKGIQMAYQRFDLVNIFQGGMGSLQWIGGVLLVWHGLGLREILLLTFLLRFLTTIGSFVLLPKFIPLFYKGIKFWDSKIFYRLIGFGGWVTVSQIINPLFLYLDRIFIGAFLSLSAVAYYAVPQEVVSRVLIIPTSICTALFPVFSGKSVFLEIENQEKIKDLYHRSIKYLLLIIIPICIGFIIFARDILVLWIGTEYGNESTLVFQIVTLGLLFNSIANVPSTLLHSFERPDLTAKIHLVELPFMILLNIILIPKIGLMGAALTWTIRVFFDAVLLFYAADRYTHLAYIKYLRTNLSRSFGIEILSFVLFFLIISFAVNTFQKMCITSLFFMIYLTWVWFRSFDEYDRQFFQSMQKRLHI